MYQTSSNFSISYFRNQAVAWLLLTIFSFSFVPSVSLAQQPTATVKTLSGDVLVSGQAAAGGTILNAGDTIQTQAGASVVLELSDGSELHLGENTQITLADLAQTATGARVSRVKLLWGRIRAFLSSEHQIEGSSFDIETPNALIGVKFSEPDIEVSYNQEKAETVGFAHTVELLAKNLLTDEKVLVPVGSSVIITTVGIKVVAGIVGIVGSSSAASTGTGTASTTASTGSTGMGTGTKVAIGAGAVAAAGGVAALAVSSGDGSNGETAESTGDLSGWWHFTGSCVAQGCTEDIPCASSPPSPPNCCGTRLCDCCDVGALKYITQSGNTLSGIYEDQYSTQILTGVVNGNSVSFTIDPDGVLGVPCANTYTGILAGNTIRGNFTGSGWSITTGGGTVSITLSGTFTVDIQK